MNSCIVCKKEKKPTDKYLFAGGTWMHCSNKGDTEEQAILACSHKCANKLTDEELHKAYKQKNGRPFKLRSPEKLVKNRPSKYKRSRTDR